MGWDGDVWVQMVLAGFSFNNGGWDRMGRSMVGGLGCRWVRLWVSMDGSVVGGFWWVSDKTQAEASSQADLYRIGFFSFLFCCDLMVDSAMVVWVVGRHFGSAFSALSFTLYSAFNAYQTLL